MLSPAWIRPDRMHRGMWETACPSHFEKEAIMVSPRSMPFFGRLRTGRDWYTHLQVGYGSSVWLGLCVAFLRQVIPFRVYLLFLFCETLVRIGFSPASSASQRSSPYDNQHHHRPLSYTTSPHLTTSPLLAEVWLIVDGFDPGGIHSFCVSVLFLLKHPDGSAVHRDALRLWES